MRPDRDLAHLRAKYADLLDPADDAELVRFLGDLEAVHTAPRVPAAAPGAGSRPPVGTAGRWQVQETAGLFPIARPAPAEHATAAPPPARHVWLPRISRAANAAIAAALIVGILSASLLLLRAGGASGTAGNPPAAQARAALLLYPGIIAGRTGIIAAADDGAAPRLLAEGDFYGVAPSPDGRHFLAYGSATGSVAELYSAEGELLRKYDLGTDRTLLANWSPDSRHIAVLARSQAVPMDDVRGVTTWLLDDRGAREIRLGESTTATSTTGMGVWSAQGRLLLHVVPRDSDGDGRISLADTGELWTVDADGNDARRLYTGRFVAMGWSSRGAEVFVIETDRLLAISDPAGTQRSVASAADLARRYLPQGAATGRQYALSVTAAAISPRNDIIAVCLSAADTPEGEREPWLMLLLDRTGRVLRQGQVEPGPPPYRVFPASDGARFAYSFTAPNTTGGIRVAAFRGDGTLATLTTLTGLDYNTVLGTALHWTPDDRALALQLGGGIYVVDGLAANGIRFVPEPSRGWPAWLPRNKP